MVQNRLRILIAQKEMATKQRITYRQLAGDTGVPMHTIQGLMTGTIKAITLESIERLCRYFDCDVADLLEIVEDRSTRYAVQGQLVTA